MSELLTDDDLKTERATEPPKRWRNWWRATMPLDCMDCGHEPAVGVPYGGCNCPSAVFPSRDIAETEAADDLNYQVAAWGHQLEEYLGAFPEGEQPNRQN